MPPRSGSGTKNECRSRCSDDAGNDNTGLGIGPASYVVNASDLHAITNGNELCKYADDTFIIIPAVNVGSRSTEICNITMFVLCIFDFNF